MLKMIGTLVNTVLLVSTLITASPVADPIQIEQTDSNTFVVRDDSNPDVKTQVSMLPAKVTYGNASVGAIILNALGWACRNSAELCDTDAPQLTQSIFVWKSSGSEPEAGNLVFAPQGQFAINMGQNYAQALAAVGDKVATGKSESWEVACVTYQCEHGLGHGSSGTDTFYTGPQSIDIVRHNTSSGAMLDSLSFSVKFEADDPESTSWCSVLDISSTIAGVLMASLVLSLAVPVGSAPRLLVVPDEWIA